MASDNDRHLEMVDCIRVAHPRTNQQADLLITVGGIWLSLWCLTISSKPATPSMPTMCGCSILFNTAGTSVFA